MSQSDIERIRNIPLRRLPSMRSGFTVIWLEDSSSSTLSENRNNKMFVGLVAQRDYYVLRYTCMSKCLKYLKRARAHEYVIVVMISSDGSDIRKGTSITAADIRRLYEYRIVQSILVLSQTLKNSDETSIQLSEKTKIDSITSVEIFQDHPSLLARLQFLLNITENFDDALFTAFNPRERALQDVGQQLGAYVWSHMYIVMLQAMNHKSPEAKNQMIAECRAQCRGMSQELEVIDTFKRKYHSADALHWYTKPCFLYRIVNKALRSVNVLDQYTFRYFIVDLHTYLEEVALATRARYTAPFYVYRGANLSRDETEQLHEGTLVATKGFFSSSRDLDVAQHFISIDPNTGMSPSRSRNDIRQFVLFHIHVDLSKLSDAIVADVSDFSAIPDENEMIFNLGTTFRITHINYDEQHYVWHIEMILSSEVAQLKSDYNQYIRKRLTEINARLLFGNVLADMSNDLIGALTYFHRLLRTIPTDDEDRPNIYFQLARVYRYMELQQQAIVYCRCAQLLQRRRLPQWNFDYARTLRGLGVIYSEIDQSERAICLYTQAMKIFRSILPEDHIEIAHVENELADAYWQKKQYDRAHMLLSAVLSFFKRKMPTDHPAKAQSLHTMGLVQHALGNREQAIDCLKEALRIRELLLAHDDPTVACTSYELSIVYAERDDEKAFALDYAKKAMRIRQAKLSPNHDDFKRSVELVEQLSAHNSEM